MVGAATRSGQRRAAVRLAVALLATAAALVAVLSVRIARAGASSATFPELVFINENPNGANEVESYSVMPSGQATLVGRYATGGQGSDQSFVASERADLSVVRTNSSAYLYALNLGDSTVSIFTINGFTGALTLDSTSPLAANAIAVNPAGTVLYAGGSTNEGGTDHLSSYRIDADGSLSASPLATITADVDGISVSPDGTEVAVAYPGTSSTTPEVQAFATDPQGDLSPGPAIQEPCPTDVRFGTDSATLYSVGCSSDALRAYSVGPAQITQTTSLSPVAGQTLAAGPDGTVYFQGAGGLQAAKVTNGSFVTGPATPYSGRTITTMSVTPDGAQLLVGSFQSVSVEDYAIGSGGSLTPLASLTTLTALPTVVTMTASCPGEPATNGLTCFDDQNTQVSVDPGAIAISTPYTSSNPFVMPALTLSPDATYLSSSAPFPAPAGPASQQIVVTSTLAGDPGWTVSVAASDLTSLGGGRIAASGLGLTGGHLIASGTFPGTVGFVDHPAHNPSRAHPDSNSGLGATPQTFATTTAGDGTAVMAGTLTLLAPTTTPAGTYTGTITFSAL